MYGGIMKTKWAMNSAFMAFYAFAMVLICWVSVTSQANFLMSSLSNIYSFRSYGYVYVQ